MAKIISIGEEKNIGKFSSEEIKYDPDFFLESLKGQLKDVVIMGIDHNDRPILSTSMFMAETNFLIDITKNLIITNSLGEIEDE